MRRELGIRHYSEKLIMHAYIWMKVHMFCRIGIREVCLKFNVFYALYYLLPGSKFSETSILQGSPYQIFSPDYPWFSSLTLNDRGGEMCIHEHIFKTSTFLGIPLIFENFLNPYINLGGPYLCKIFWKSHINSEGASLNFTHCQNEVLTLTYIFGIIKQGEIIKSFTLWRRP